MMWDRAVEVLAGIVGVGITSRHCSTNESREFRGVPACYGRYYDEHAEKTGYGVVSQD